MNSEVAKLFIEQAPLSIIQIAADSRILYANKTACRNTGYTFDDFLTLTVPDINPTISHDQWPEFWQNLREQGTETLETTHTHKSGFSYQVEIHVSLMELDGEECAIALVQNITSRKEAEAKLLLTKFFFEKAPVGIIRSDRNAKILDVNEEVSTSLGYSPEELKKMTLFEINPEITQEHMHQFWQTYDDPRFDYQDSGTIETLHKHRNGAVFPVMITSKRLEYDGDVYSVAFVTDITEKKREAQRKANLTSRLQHAQRLESLGTLAGGIAHDFNNILSAIIGYTELLELNLADTTGVDKFLRPLNDAGLRAKDLVHQILTFSRQGETKLTPTDISRPIQEALNLIQATISLDIEIEQNIPPGLGVTLTDKILIHQLVMNLCTNAYHAMEAQGGTLTVTLEQTVLTPGQLNQFPELAPGGYLSLMVSDTGHGIDEKTMGKIFDPYFTTKEQGKGTGLGLATVHSIIKQHGGGISVQSEPGKGTVFQILFPIMKHDEKTTKTEPASLPRGRERVLLVDNEKAILDINRQLLEELGYRVEIFSDPSDALIYFNDQPDRYDLIISDLTMPRKTGEDLARSMKEKRPNLPFILCSGFSTRINTNRLLQAGIDKILMKPVNIQELATAIRDVLERTTFKQQG